MPKFLYGEILIKVITIDAEDESQALATLNESQRVSEVGEYKRSYFDKVMYALKWGETPAVDVEGTRNGVLQEFLNLMQNIIPSSQPMKKVEATEVEPRRIITLEDYTKGKV